MPKPKDQECGSCKFFFEVGEECTCHRHPPKGTEVVLGRGVREPSKVKIRFPLTQSSEWCGEWQKK